MKSLFFLGLLFLLLGLAGFTRKGLPLTSRRRLIGTRGKLVGGLSLTVGLAVVVLAYLGAGPVDRVALSLLSRGMLVGVLGTSWLLLRPT